MKRRLGLISALLVICLLTGCGVRTQAAKNTNMVVTDPEYNISNRELWDEFYAKVRAGKEAAVSAAVYETEENYLIYTVRFDGSSYHLTTDASHHSFWDGKDDPAPETFQYLQVLETRGHQVAVLSDAPYEDYDALNAFFKTARENNTAPDPVPEKLPYCFLIWKE